MRIQTKRIYDDPADEDGNRVLVDRLWPRGLPKLTADITLWARDLAPSPKLRTWWHHDPERFDEFADRYRAELRERDDAIEDMLARIDRRRRLTLLYAARDRSVNHAVVLADYLRDRGFARHPPT